MDYWIYFEVGEVLVDCLRNNGFLCVFGKLYRDVEFLWWVGG